MCWADISSSFYSHFSCMSVGILYSRVLASIEKHFVIHKINSFVFKSLSCLFLIFFFCFHYYHVSICLLSSLSHCAKNPFYLFVHSSCIITHSCCRLSSPFCPIYKPPKTLLPSINIKLWLWLANVYGIKWRSSDSTWPRLCSRSGPFV